MNAMQKLSRLKQISDQLAHPPAENDINARMRRQALEGERTAILDSVGRPPEALLGVMDHAKWGEAFVSTFPYVADTMVAPWFDMALSVGYDEGRGVGQLEGNQQVNEDFTKLRDTLVLVRDLLESGRARANRLRDRETGEESTLGEIVGRALQRAGIS